MDIKSPRRILILGPPDVGVLNLITSLTGSAPTPVDNSTAGLSHIWPIKTNYYTADVPIWIDEISNLEAWIKDFSDEDAREVVVSLGAWIYVFRRPVSEYDYEAIKQALKGIQQVIEKAAGYTWDGTCLAVAMAQSQTPYLEKSNDEWEDMVREYGFEYIDSEATGKNQFGEAVGISRIKEAIGTTDWNADEDFVDVDGNEDDYLASFDAEEAEMGRELLGLKTAVANGGQGREDDEDVEAQVEETQRMMAQLQAIKETGSSMAPDERKKFAANAVNNLMKDW